LENIILPDAPYLKKQYYKFYEKHGYMPKFFQPYNCAEVKDYAHTLTISSGSTTGCGQCLIVEEIQLKGE